MPYHSFAIVESHPDRVGAIASLMNLAPPDVATARVLELGCAGGGNLVPMALIAPEGRYVGVDLSPKQIEQAQAFAHSCGARNIEFRSLSISDITPELGEFDYIICHGVYSWVPEEIKDALLQVCSRNLAPNGIAYVSYNVYPGWHVPVMIREMMLYHIRKLSDPEVRVKSARAFLEFLADSALEKESHYARTLRDEAVALRPHADSYVAHEHLEEINQPIYFHEFISCATKHKLKLVSDARFWISAAAAPPAIAQVLDRLAADVVEREQYLDFLTSRRFHRTVLCHESLKPDYIPTPERMKRLRFSASVWPATQPPDIAGKTSLPFRSSDGVTRLTTSESVVKAALVTLTEALPHSLPFDELWNRTRHKLRSLGADPGDSHDLLANRLLQCYGGNSVELHVFEPRSQRRLRNGRLPCHRLRFARRRPAKSQICAIT